MKSGYWQELTTSDFAKIDADRTIAVLPMGAIEQHGPHLPLWTDTLIAESLSGALIEKLNSKTEEEERKRPVVLVLPTIAVGFSPEHSSFPGTLTLPYQTLVDQIFSLCECVSACGVRKVMFLNCHGGNPPVMEIAAMLLRQKLGMLVVKTTALHFASDLGNLGAENGHCCKMGTDRDEKYGIHGGTLETSIVMHLRPDLVRMHELRDYPSLDEEMVAQFEFLSAEARPYARFAWKSEDLNRQGAMGEAHLATKAKGKAAFEHFVSILQRIVTDVSLVKLNNALPALTVELRSNLGPEPLCGDATGIKTRTAANNELA